MTFPMAMAEDTLPATQDPRAFASAEFGDGYLITEPPAPSGKGAFRHFDARGETFSMCVFHSKGQTAPSTKVIGLNGASVFGREGVVVTRDGVLLIETQQSVHALTRWGLLDAEALRALTAADRPTVHLPGRCLSMLYVNYRNWYHWLIENLARLRSLGMLADTDEVRIIVPDDLPQPHYESVLRLGISPDRLVRYDGAARLVCERLYVPSFPTQGGTLRTDSMAWLRAKLRPQPSHAVGAPCGPPALFVSRADSVRRHILNEEALRRALEPLGIAFATLAALPLMEQAALFASARMVVGVHGAGLANLLFAPENAMAVELVAQKESMEEAGLSLPRLYRQLATACGLRYLSIACVDFDQYDVNWTLSDDSMSNLVRILRPALAAANLQGGVGTCAAP